MSFIISLPIFLIIALGWSLKKFKLVTDQWIHILNSFAYYVSLPAIIICSLWDVDFTSRESMYLSIFSISAFAIFSIFTFLFLHILKISKNTKAAIFLAGTTGNTVYMAFPIIESAYGKQAMPNAALTSIIFLVPPLLMAIFVVRFWYSKEHSITKEIVSFIKNPLVLSVVVGIILSFYKLNDPITLGVKKTLTMLGATASPLALFVLGAFLYGKFLKKDLHLVALASALKMIIFPLVLMGIYAYVLKINHYQIPVMMSAMPVAVTTFVIAEKFNLDKMLVGNTIFVSTLISFFLLPLLITLI